MNMICFKIKRYRILKWTDLPLAGYLAKQRTHLGTRYWTESLHLRPSSLWGSSTEIQSRTEFQTYLKARWTSRWWIWLEKIIFSSMAFWVQLTHSCDYRKLKFKCSSIDCIYSIPSGRNYVAAHSSASVTLDLLHSLLEIMTTLKEGLFK